MIQTKALSRTFAGPDRSVVHAIRDVDFAVDSGESVAILGPNGAGKSTLMRMLSTLLPPTGGRATVAGHDVVTGSHAVRSVLGYVGQGSSGGQAQRVCDEVTTQARIYGAGRAQAQHRAREMLDILELSHLAKRRTATLSGGQRRRLDLALGLVHSPRLLFLDEPTTGLDPQNRASLWEHIRTIREQTGMTLVVTTHYLEEADSAADRIVVVDHGRLIADGTSADLKRMHGGREGATLDDVFLALTGRSLRDAGTAPSAAAAPDTAARDSEVDR